MSLWDKIYSRVGSRISPSSNIATRVFGGRMSAIDNTVASTYQITTVAPQNFDSIRVIFANTALAFAVNSINSRACVIPNLSDINNSAGTWVDVTKSGQKGFLAPNAPGTNRISYLVSDNIPLKSVPRTDGTFPLVTVRVFVSSTGILPGYGLSGDSFTNWATNPNGHLWISRQQTGNHIDILTGFTSTTNTSQSPIVGIQFYCQGKAVSVMCVGDSIYEGRGTRINEGFIMPAVVSLSDQSKTVLSYSNCAWSGQASTTYCKRAIDILNSPIKPDVLVMPIGSPNDVSTGSITSAHIQTMSANIMAVVAKCAEKGVKLILCTWMSTNTGVRSYGASDSLRVDYNNLFLGMRNKDFEIVDTALTLQGVLSGGQYQMLAGSTDDGIHPNDTGNALLTNLITPVIKRISGI